MFVDESGLPVSGDGIPELHSTKLTLPHRPAASLAWDGRTSKERSEKALPTGVRASERASPRDTVSPEEATGATAVVPRPAASLPLRYQRARREQCPDGAMRWIPHAAGQRYAPLCRACRMHLGSRQSLHGDRSDPRTPLTLGPGKVWAWGGLCFQVQQRSDARSATVRVRFPVVAPLRLIADTLFSFCPKLLSLAICGESASGGVSSSPATLYKRRFPLDRDIVDSSNQSTIAHPLTNPGSRLSLLLWHRKPACQLFTFEHVYFKATYPLSSHSTVPSKFRPQGTSNHNALVHPHFIIGSTPAAVSKPHTQPCPNSHANPGLRHLASPFRHMPAHPHSTAKSALSHP